MNVRKGPYAAQDGDLATAGAIEFRTKDRLLGKAEVRGGSFETGRALALIPFGGDATKFGGYAAGAYSQTNGPFIAPQNFQAGNGMVRMTAPLGRNTRLTFTGSGYGASWEASGQIPARAVNDGTIPRFGAVDATEGGNTHRYEASVAIGGEGSGGSQWSARVFGVNYYLNLFSNFTFFLVDSTNGDGIEQRDDRMLYGALGSYERPTQYGSVRGNLALGVTLRMDNAEVALFDQVARTRLNTRIANNINQQNGAVWARQNLAFGQRVTLQLGLRGDLFHFNVSPDNSFPPGAEPPASGTSHAGPHQPEGQPDRTRRRATPRSTRTSGWDFTRMTRGTSSPRPTRLRCSREPPARSSACDSRGRAAASPLPAGRCGSKASWRSWATRASRN